MWQVNPKLIQARKSSTISHQKSKTQTLKTLQACVKPQYQASNKGLTCS